MQCAAREQELKFLRDFGVNDKVDEREVSAQYQVTPVCTTWVDTDKPFEGDPCKSDQEWLRQNSRVTTSQICMRGPLHWERCSP